MQKWSHDLSWKRQRYYKQLLIQLSQLSDAGGRPTAVVAEGNVVASRLLANDKQDAR